MHTLKLPFLEAYVRLSPREMHDFSLRQLHTFYLRPERHDQKSITLKLHALKIFQNIYDQSL